MSGKTSFCLLDIGLRSTTRIAGCNHDMNASHSASTSGSAHRPFKMGDVDNFKFPDAVAVSSPIIVVAIEYFKNFDLFRFAADETYDGSIIPGTSGRNGQCALEYSRGEHSFSSHPFAIQC